MKTVITIYIVRTITRHDGHHAAYLFSGFRFGQFDVFDDRVGLLGIDRGNTHGLFLLCCIRFFLEESIPDFVSCPVRDIPDHMRLTRFVLGMFVMRYIHSNRHPESTIPDMIKDVFFSPTQNIVRSKRGGGSARFLLFSLRRRRRLLVSTTNLRNDCYVMLADIGTVDRAVLLCLLARRP